MCVEAPNHFPSHHPKRIRQARHTLIDCGPPGKEGSIEEKDSNHVSEHKSLSMFAPHPHGPQQKGIHLRHEIRSATAAMPRIKFLISRNSHSQMPKKKGGATSPYKPSNTHPWRRTQTGSRDSKRSGCLGKIARCPNARLKGCTETCPLEYAARNINV